MPCCESKLPYQMSDINGYRGHVGLKPDGTEPRKWVRNGIVKHEKKVKMTLEELEVAFDLSRFASSESNNGGIDGAIDYLFKNSNRLGSRPLSEADNPIALCSYYHLWEPPFINKEGHLQLWLYDERLFNWRDIKRVPIKELETIPEGVFPCIDTKNSLHSHNLIDHPEIRSGGFSLYGIIRPAERGDFGLLSGVSTFIEIGAITYNNLGNWMYGVFGKGIHAEDHAEE